MPKARAAAVLVVLLAVAVQCQRIPAQDRTIPDDLKDLRLDDFGLKPVMPRQDPDTGFVVGGKNATALIRGLTKINGRTIAQLEADLRPDGGTEGMIGVRSRAGFLGPDEKLLEVLAEDNRYVVDQLGLTHQELARPLHIMGGAMQSNKGPKKFLYHGRRLQVEITFWKGSQLSPFYDDTETSQDALVKNLDNGKELKYSLLVPHMITRYGFYEGKGTPYRVEPRQIVEVFDFLRGESAPSSGESAPSNRPIVGWAIALGIVLSVGVAVAILRSRRNRALM